MGRKKKTLSILQAAKECDVHRTTLMRWLAEGRITASEEIRLPRFTVEDVEKIKRYMSENFWKRERQ